VLNVIQGTSVQNNRKKDKEIDSETVNTITVELDVTKHMNISFYTCDATLHTTQNQGHYSLLVSYDNAMAVAGKCCLRLSSFLLSISNDESKLNQQ
jgi:hypothetical protein